MLARMGLMVSRGAPELINTFDSDITGITLLGGFGTNAAAYHETVSPITGAGSLGIVATTLSSVTNRPRITFNPVAALVAGKSYDYVLRKKSVSTSTRFTVVSAGQAALVIGGVNVLFSETLADSDGVVSQSGTIVAASTVAPFIQINGTQAFDCLFELSLQEGL